MALPPTPLNDLLYSCKGSAERMVGELIKRNWLNEKEINHKEQIILKIENIIEEINRAEPMPGLTPIDGVGRYIRSILNENFDENFDCISYQSILSFIRLTKSFLLLTEKW